MQSSTMNSTVNEIRKLLESSDKSYDSSQLENKAVFAAGLTVATIVAVLIVKCIMRCHRRYVSEPQFYPPTASDASWPGQRRHELEVSMPVRIYGAGPPVSSSSSADTTSYEVEMCAICLGEFEKGERVSVLPRCKHMFHMDCIRQWVPEKSMNCPMCRVPTVGEDEWASRCRYGRS